MMLDFDEMMKLWNDLRDSPWRVDAFVECQTQGDGYGPWACVFDAAWDAAAEVVETDSGWLCPCGHWEDSHLHCLLCGFEPPWGCDCGMHEAAEDDEDFEADEWPA